MTKLSIKNHMLTFNIWCSKDTSMLKQMMQIVKEDIYVSVVGKSLIIQIPNVRPVAHWFKKVNFKTQYH